MTTSIAKHPQPVEPFGEVWVEKTSTGFSVRATILMVPPEHSACTALAIDASASMQPVYGIKSGPFPSPKPNFVEPVARTMSAFLSRFSTDSKCTTIYWACSPDGSAIEEIGRYTADEVANISISGPQRHPWGKQTKLMPPVKHFVENTFLNSPWSIGVVITDGIVDDLGDVKDYCLKIGQELASGARQFFKLVLIGIGDQIDERQMIELDNMFRGSNLHMPDGTPIDIWDHKIASEMQKLEDIFSEIVTKDAIVVESGRIVDDKGSVVKEYNSGVPAMLTFDLLAGAKSFRVEWPGGSVEQCLAAAIAKL